MGKVISYNLLKKKCGECNMCKILEKIQNKTALELLEEYNIPLTPPIDIATLLRNIGIYFGSKDFSEAEQLANAQKGTILGVALSNHDDLCILYRSKDSYNRKRFTAAHELAHCCLHSADLKIQHIEFRTFCESEDIREIEANIFASELLIPKKVLMPIYKQFIVPSLKALAEIFHVSTSVMAARLDYLNLPYYKDAKLSEQ